MSGLPWVSVYRRWANGIVGDSRVVSSADPATHGRPPLELSELEVSLWQAPDGSYQLYSGDTMLAAYPDAETAMIAAMFV